MRRSTQLTAVASLLADSCDFFLHGIFAFDIPLLRVKLYMLRAVRSVVHFAISGFKFSLNTPSGMGDQETFAMLRYTQVHSG